MPSKRSKSVRSTGAPKAREIAAQLERLSAEPSLRGDKRGFLLNFLVQQKQERRYVGPFAPDKRPTGKLIMYEFYEKWSIDAGEAMQTDKAIVEVNGKKLIAELADKLDEYYAKHSDRVVIKILRGRNDGYQPMIAYRGDPRFPATQTTPVEKLSSGGKGTDPADRHVECVYLGNDREAMKYVIERYHQSSSVSPKLIAVRDTHVRPSIPLRYPEDHKELEAAFGAFLLNIEPEATFATMVLGHEVDREYMKMIQRATKGHGDKLKCFRLRTPGHLMNFILMDYDDFTSEVLFGWGQGKPGWAGAVFQSRDTRLVEEFSNLYEVLLQGSDQVPITAILAP